MKTCCLCAGQRLPLPRETQDMPRSHLSRHLRHRRRQCSRLHRDPTPPVHRPGRHHPRLG